MNPLDERFVKAVTLVREALRITAFTGAGISDFRGPGGSGTATASSRIRNLSQS
jgi:NAD-dependent SIR2 family protein deacetylase